MCEPDKQDLYAVLGASPSDSVQQLRHRYQQLALKHHPDHLGVDRCSEAEPAVSRFVEVHAAWKVLSDPNTRRQYDLQRRAQQLIQDLPVDCTVSLKDMMWDQDQRSHTYCCRCGGRFSISQEEVEEETCLKQQDEAEEDVAVLLCCDTCSLSLHVTWPSSRRTQRLK